MDRATDGNTKKEPRVNSIPGDPLCGKILFLSDWVKTQEEAAQGKQCLPCDISTIAPWYRDLLKKRGYKELSEKVNALAEGDPTNLKIAEVLDEVRESVKDEDTKKELLTYDCMMQTYEEENEKGG
jgi:hypothetical protein